MIVKSIPSSKNNSNSSSSSNNSNNNVPIITEPTIVYTKSDFGINTLNIHNSSDGSHSERCAFIFNYIVSKYGYNLPCIQTYKDSAYSSLNSTTAMSICKTAQADLMFFPYVGAASGMNGNFQGLILNVGSHFDNNGSDGILDNSDRHDITNNSYTFLDNSVAVSARRDTLEGIEGSTSFGYGMEFFEDCSPEGLDYQFPDKDILEAIAEIKSTDGITIKSTVHPNFANKRTVGDQITIKYSSDPSTWKVTTITEIISGGEIKVSPSITPTENNGIYAWAYMTLGSYLYGQAESWAVPIVAAKLKIIRLKTNADWNTIRIAARNTAKRNILNDDRYDIGNWDIYRGFGSIQIQAAINYINNS